MASIEINMPVTKEEFQAAAKESGAKAAVYLDPELRKFDVYLETRNMDPMGKIERSILREYLGWKLVVADEVR